MGKLNVSFNAIQPFKKNYSAWGMSDLGGSYLLGACISYSLELPLKYSENSPVTKGTMGTQNFLTSYEKAGIGIFI
jgi:hypothetical protein